MVNKDLKRASASLVTGEKQIKTTVRFHYISIKMAYVENNGNTRCWQGPSWTARTGRGEGEVHSHSGEAVS